jgi:integrase
MKTGEETTTKTRSRVRDVPIHPYLLPMLKTMGKGKSATDRVFPVERVRHTEQDVKRLREHLLAAGIDRPELQHGTQTLKAFDVRSLRTCFATWCRRSGCDSADIDVWLGHKPKTTAAKHYVKDTGTLPAGVFPKLPLEITDGDVNPGVKCERPPSMIPDGYLCEGRDLNPYRSYPTGT